MRHGSHLYGTATASSDIDYKGVAMPNPADVLLGRIPKVTESIAPDKEDGAKNRAGDIELQVFSLHHFVALALKGETVAVDMLHAPRSACSVWTYPWSTLVENRHRFYTRNMKSLVGYARAQAAKYGLRGSRLSAAKEVLALLRAAKPGDRMIDHVSSLPEGEFVKRSSGAPDLQIPLFSVCGMQFPVTATAGYVADRLEGFIERYGERAKMAEENKGVDWKAISHAFRAAYQLRDILLHGGFEYPLRDAQYLIEIKLGLHSYTSAIGELEATLDDVERLTAESSLPMEPDRQWAEIFTMSLTADHLAARKS
jgi:hypothetical protein